ncbi:hypothetical protein VP01_9198g1 [Puccinia sorghi]|uniref:Uncharacterized protein n=1 Tax=Puccinia sorghi TaxID=27349 RepID=A0A0L6U7E1_9BASI|nr:hypothetical protein VP01_9198g1 [Puccinia sorghi]
MPQSSTRSKALGKIRTRLQYHIAKAAFEARFKSSNDDSSEITLKDLLTSLHTFSFSISFDSYKNLLMVTLHQMGMSGNGTSVGLLARFFRISEGSVIVYSSCVVEAILSLERFVFFFLRQPQKYG